MPWTAWRDFLPRLHPRGSRPNLVVLDAKPEVMAPRHIVRQEDRAVGIAEIGGIGEREQRLREQRVRKLQQRLAETRPALDVPASQRARHVADGLSQDGAHLGLS